MMLLLDTHILVWALLADPALTVQARTLLTDPANTIFASSVSYCEVAIKRSLGRSGLACSAQDLAGYVSHCRIGVLDLRPAHVITLETLPWIHRDPFDRMLIAQALTEPMRLVTHDKTVARYSNTIITV